MERECKIHGVHNKWRVKQPNTEKGWGFRYECRLCRGKRDREKERQQRTEKNHALVLKYLGQEEADRYKAEGYPHVKKYLVKIQGEYWPAITAERTNGSIIKRRRRLVTNGRFKDHIQNPRCEKCGIRRPVPGFFEMHHIVPRSEGGDNSENNLIILCPNCHKDAHLGKEYPPFYTGG